MITTEQIKELRDATGVSVMQCKKALEEAEGNMEKALMILKKKSSEIAAKKSDREASQGMVAVASEPGKTVMLVLNCETDFVAKNEDFTALAKNLAQEALTSGVEAMKSNSAQKISEVIQKVGENIILGEVKEITGASAISSYVHNDKIGAVVALNGGDEALAKDLAMHVAAMNPEYTVRGDIPEEKRALAHELFAKEVAESDKSEDIKAKMLQGKIDSYFKEQTLMDQGFFKDQNTTIENLLKSKNATLVTFVRFAI